MLTKMGGFGRSPAMPRTTRIVPRLGLGVDKLTPTCGRTQSLAGQLAATGAVRLDRTGQLAANRGRRDGDSVMRLSWQPLRRRRLERTCNPVTPSRIDAPKSGLSWQGRLLASRHTYMP